MSTSKDRRWGVMVKKRERGTEGWFEIPRTRKRSERGVRTSLEGRQGEKIQSRIWQWSWHIIFWPSMLQSHRCQMWCRGHHTPKYGSFTSQHWSHWSDFLIGVWIESWHEGQWDTKHICANANIPTYVYIWNTLNDWSHHRIWILHLYW